MSESKPSTFQSVLPGRQMISNRRLASLLVTVAVVSILGTSAFMSIIQTKNTSPLPSSNNHPWTAAASLNVGRSFSAVATLKNGSLLVAGGFAGAVSDSSISSAELYNPSTNKWTMTATMRVGRAGALAATLNNGDVLVTGGVGSSGVFTSCELYNPITNTWTMTGNMSQARYDHQIVPLNDGRVFVVGGDFGGTENNVTETYDPSSGTWTTAPLNLWREPT